jgi:hypothetical protein
MVQGEIVSFNWTPSSKFCASSAHIGWAIAAVLAFLHNGLPVDWAVIGFVAYAVVKEYVIDLSILDNLVTWFESKGVPGFLVGWLALEHDSLAGSTLDFVTYGVGVGLGVLAFFHVYAAAVLAVGVLITMSILDKNGFFIRNFGYGVRR